MCMEQTKNTPALMNVALLYKFNGAQGAQSFRTPAMLTLMTLQDTFSQIRRLSLAVFSLGVAKTRPKQVLEMAGL